MQPLILKEGDVFSGIDSGNDSFNLIILENYDSSKSSQGVCARWVRKKDWDAGREFSGDYKHHFNYTPSTYDVFDKRFDLKRNLRRDLTPTVEKETVDLWQL